MQVLACSNSCSLNLNCNNVKSHSSMGRRELLSTLCSTSSPKDIVSPKPISILRTVSEGIMHLGEEIIGKSIPFATRRMLLASFFAYLSYHPSRYLSAQALGDPTVRVEDVTPPVFPSGALFPSEDRTVQLFEKNTYSVVNIFDITLRPQLNVTGAVEIPEGNGSGVVWDEQGHIVTNYHVIGNSLSRNPSPGQVVARVNILASEGVQKNFEGKLIGADRTKDLAVLKVEASEDLLRPIKVGQSSTLRVGQQCLAIGNPFGFDHTLTVGVISGLNRDIFSQTGVTIGGGIQTDAAINPGNSGGPLLDSKGNLIGINTAIFTQTGTSAGVGFAIPSSTVLKIVPQLIQFGKAVRAGLNIEIAPELIANQLNVRKGALILQVPGNSLAAKAGLLPTTRGFAGNIILGDIILAVNNKPVKNKGELYKALDDYNVGDKVTLKIQRGGENMDLPVMLEEISS
ncbi:Trypsin family protein with PDZ domain [Theobroma cacao]|uniref:Trypsin family protein with PDZ domain n=1 Tax=Theobroma cacao TaxID=3641 RepID=A0A061EET1_THECC|nr:Trypsin family protein with PDZ domain [Theobroma cacao]